MGRTKEGDGIKSHLIVAEVQKRACLFDTNHPHYGDRGEKARSWEEVCECIVPGWTGFGASEKLAAGKDRLLICEVYRTVPTCVKHNDRRVSVA